MNRLFYLLIACLAALPLIGCIFDSEDDSLDRFTASGEKYSPLKFQGKISYMPMMAPESARVVLLDEHLDSVKSVTVPVGWDPHLSAFTFTTKKLNFPSPYVKVVSMFPVDGSSKMMEFEEYASVIDGGATRVRYSVQSFFGALTTSRVDYLVREHGYDLNVARDVAKKELVKIFELKENQDYSGEFKNNLEFIKPYFYSRHFVSDSVFHSEYQNLREIFVQEKKIPKESLVRIADDLIRLSVLDSARIVCLDSKDSIYERRGEYWNTGYDFMMKIWNDAYDLDLTYFESERTIDCELSDYNGRTLVLDGNSYKSHDSRWRLKSALEDSVGVCHNYRIDLGEWNGTYYYCADGSSVWEETDDRSIILDGDDCRYMLGDSERRVYHDTTFVCTYEAGEYSWTVLNEQEDVNE